MKQNLLRKVPQVTAIFWVVKILTTALGESTTDYLVQVIDQVIAVIFGAIGLGVALLLQFKARKYIAWVYWLAVVMVAVFGTMAADVAHIVLGCHTSTQQSSFSSRSLARSLCGTSSSIHCPSIAS